VESRPQKRTLEEQNLPESAPQNAEQLAGTSSENLREVLQRLWEAVRHGADVIVTLRQENSILQSQLSTLRHSEQDLQARVNSFLERIAALESNAIAGPGAIDRLEDTGWNVEARIEELERGLAQALAERSDAEERLALAEASLAKAAEQLAENYEISQQVIQLRTELEIRSKLLEELQMDMAEHPRTATEAEPGLDQLDLFREEAMSVARSGDLSLVQVADRLEEIARQLDELSGLS
jgi:chromosome segregation ATPase